MQEISHTDKLHLINLYWQIIFVLRSKVHEIAKMWSNGVETNKQLRISFLSNKHEFISNWVTIKNRKFCVNIVLLSVQVNRHYVTSRNHDEAQNSGFRVFFGKVLCARSEYYICISVSAQKCSHQDTSICHFDFQ